MTSMLHRFPDDDGFIRGLRRAQLEYVCNSRAAAATLAENYVGLAGSGESEEDVSKVEDLFDVRDARVVVTGAASGLGLAMAEVMADAGARVTLADLDPEEAGGGDGPACRRPAGRCGRSSWTSRTASRCRG